MHSFNRFLIRGGLGWLFVLVTAWTASSQDIQLEPVSDTYAITNVNIIQGPGRRIDLGTVVIKNGLIHAVGKTIPVPPEAIIIKADSMYLYAGFIDGLSHTGVGKSPQDVASVKPKDPGNPPPDRAGITPHQDVRDFIDPADRPIAELRSVGFTVAHVVPHGVFLPGKGAIISLGGSSGDAMVLVSNASLYSELSWTHGVYPGTVMGVMAKWRELYQQASLAKSYQALYASNSAGLERPTIDRVLESFYPVIDRKMPVFFKVEKINDIHRVLTLQKDLGFSLMTGELKEGWGAADKIKASGVKTFLSLDLPDDNIYEDKDKRDDKKHYTKQMGESRTITQAERQQLENRKMEFIMRYVNQAKAFQKAGVKFGFSTMDVKAKDIHCNLRWIIDSGLSEDEVLAALTTNPAEMLGLSGRMGTIDKGKMANLILSDRPYFSEKRKIRYVFVDGQPYECGWKEKKKFHEKKAPADVEGTWSFITETPEGKVDLKVIFTKTDDKLAGSISGGRLPKPIDFSSVELDGNSLKFVYSATIETDTIEVTIEGSVDGAAFNGSMQVGKYGVFPMEGTREPKF